MTMSVMRLLGYFVNAVISWVIMLPVSITLMAVFGMGMAFHATPLLITRVVSLAAGLAPYLLILGAARKGLEDMFSNTVVIKVDR
jgi:hypothetical protein